jgi:hypothetical protein
MFSIKVKLPDGSIAEYVKPSHCPFLDEDWHNVFSFCGGFEIIDGKGFPQCSFTDECSID